MELRGSSPRLRQHVHPKAPRQPTRPSLGTCDRTFEPRREAGRRRSFPAKVRKSFERRAGPQSGSPSALRTHSAGWFPSETGLTPAGLELQPWGLALHKWPWRPRPGREVRGPARPRSLPGPGSAGAGDTRCGRDSAGCGNPEPAPGSDPQIPRGPRQSGWGMARQTDGRTRGRTRPGRRRGAGSGGSPGAAGGAGGNPGTRALNFPRTRCQGRCFLFNIFY